MTIAGRLSRDFKLFLEPSRSGSGSGMTRIVGLSLAALFFGQVHGEYSPGEVLLLLRQKRKPSPSPRDGLSCHSEDEFRVHPYHSSSACTQNCLATEATSVSFWISACGIMFSTRPVHPELSLESIDDLIDSSFDILR